MAKWRNFGDQLNRLVYALAGKKFHANISAANRFIAQSTNYSEDSIRMMRQGKFLPDNQQTLMTLIKIGKQDADLGKEWAIHLLKAAQVSDSAQILHTSFPETPERLIAKPQLTPSFSPRLVGTAVGCFALLFLWTYLIHPTYPAPHELSLFWECTWGMLIGLGCAAGLFVSDLSTKKMLFNTTKMIWPTYLLLPIGGILGAICWNLITHTLQNHLLSSTAWETICFGAIYGLAFGTVISLSRKAANYQFFPIHPLLIVAICTGIGSLMALSGYLFATLQPSFANQKDIDIFVGLMLRIAIIFNIGLFFPIPVRISKP